MGSIKFITVSNIFDFQKEFDLESESNLQEIPVIYLIGDRWNDYGYTSYFGIFLSFPKDNIPVGYNPMIDLGYVRIGKENQSTSDIIRHEIGAEFYGLPENYFSLSLSENYYEKIIELHELEIIDSEQYFRSMRDIAFDINYLGKYKSDYPDYKSFKFDKHLAGKLSDGCVINNSLLRDLKSSSHIEKLHRIANMNPIFSKYKVSIDIDTEYAYGNMELSPINEGSRIEKMLNKNIYCLIGPNGCGKTTVLQSLHYSINKGIKDTESEVRVRFLPEDSGNGHPSIYISLSPFDRDMSDVITQDNYLGLQLDFGIKISEVTDNMPSKFKKRFESIENKSYRELWFIDFLQSVNEIRESNRFAKWLNTIHRIVPNVSDHEGTFNEIAKDKRSSGDKYYNDLYKLMMEQSSGISFMLLAITKIFAIKDSGTLILIDEPENHLQPPMLSSFMDALSYVCNSTNSIALIATHSPVTVQELDRTNVFIMRNIGSGRMEFSNPDENTFGENIGKINRTIFGFEIEKSGYYKKISYFADTISRNNEISKEFEQRLGLEARMIVNSMKTRLGNSND